jgi:hypothetical protein
MTEPSAVNAPAASSGAEAKAFVDELRAGLAAGTLVPYLGHGVSAWVPGEVPSTPEALADFLGDKLALPRRARGNLWASAQYIQTQRHRATLENWLDEAFSKLSEPNPLHRRLAQYKLPLIVDTWYDASMRRALSGRTDWVEIQGISRVVIGEDRWVRAFGPGGDDLPLTAADAATTLLYKPVGSASPIKNFIISDSDYVEVLTEIDIQTPIPEIVRQRRSKLGFAFLGCRFNEQTLRTYARQISKRSKGPNYCVIDPAQAPTPNEERFYREMNMKVLYFPWSEIFGMLAAA